LRRVESGGAGHEAPPLPFACGRVLPTRVEECYRVDRSRSSCSLHFGQLKPHPGHTDAGLVPQRPRNAIAGGLSKAHCGQVTIRAPAMPPSPAPASTSSHLAVHRSRGGEVLMRQLALAGAPVELPEAKVAVGDDGAHLWSNASLIFP